MDCRGASDPELPQEAPAPARRVNLIIDIQERMAQGKGPAYERWAKVYNLKQMAAALQYLREKDLMDYDALAASTEKAVERFHALSEELRQTEAELEKTSGLMAATVDYAKPGLCLMVTKRPGTVKSICRSMRRSLLLTGRPGLL